MNEVPPATHREQIGLQVPFLTSGQVFAPPVRRTITDFDNIAAALLAMNTHPLHSDYAFAAQSRFKKPLIVSPFLLSCLVAAVMNELRDMQLAAFEIQELTFTAPVHPGDTISTEAVVESSDAVQTVLRVRGMKAKGGSFAQFRMVLRTQAPSA